MADDIKKYFDYLTKITEKNNTYSAKQAQKEMDFQAQMSNTAHVREVKDLKAAGLNPVLSVTGGGSGGASTPSGAMGETDTGMTSAASHLISTKMQNENQIKVAEIQSRAAMASASAARYAADIQKEIALIQQGNQSPLRRLGNDVINALQSGEIPVWMEDAFNKIGNFIQGQLGLGSSGKTENSLGESLRNELLLKVKEDTQKQMDTGFKNFSDSGFSSKMKQMLRYNNLDPSLASKPEARGLLVRIAKDHGFDDRGFKWQDVDQVKRLWNWYSSPACPSDFWNIWLRRLSK